MKYFLKINSLGSCPEIEIDADRFQKLNESRDILTNALAIEEKYELLLQNYLEFEKGLLAVATEAMVRTRVDYEDLFYARIALDRLVVNFLTTAKLYIDQLERHVVKCLPHDENVKSSVTAWFHTQYDSSIEYRFMEALRNFVQHRDLAVHLMGTGGEWTSLDDAGMLKKVVNLSTAKLSLEKDSVFKKAVLEEIGEKVDLKIFTRGYTACLSNIHGQAREMIQENVDSARGMVETGIEEYSEVYQGIDIIGLCALAVSDGSIKETVPMFLELDDIRIKLVKRNGSLSNLKKWYVTGE